MPARRPRHEEGARRRGITRANFNALVEVLQEAMDAQGVPFGVQNRLLSQLAPMHRDIINTPEADAR